MESLQAANEALVREAQARVSPHKLSTSSRREKRHKKQIADYQSEDGALNDKLTKEQKNVEKEKTLKRKLKFEVSSLKKKVTKMEVIEESQSTAHDCILQEMEQQTTHQKQIILNLQEENKHLQQLLSEKKKLYHQTEIRRQVVFNRNTYMCVQTANS